MVLLASDFDRSRFLKAADLDKEKKFRIKSVTAEEIGGDKERKLIAWFTNDDRGLALNKTNIRALRGAYGDVVDAWIGKVIVIFPTVTDFRGQMKPALRIRIPPPKQAVGNDLSTAASKPKPPVDSELQGGSEQPPTKPAASSADDDDLDDEIPW